MSSEMSSLEPNQIYRVLRPEPQSQDLKHSLPHSLLARDRCYLVSGPGKQFEDFILLQITVQSEGTKGNFKGLKTNRKCYHYQ